MLRNIHILSLDWNGGVDFCIIELKRMSQIGIYFYFFNDKDYNHDSVRNIIILQL